LSAILWRGGWPGVRRGGDLMASVVYRRYSDINGVKLNNRRLFGWPWHRKLDVWPCLSAYLGVRPSDGVSIGGAAYFL
jgi:hypothetical protein